MDVEEVYRRLVRNALLRDEKREERNIHALIPRTWSSDLERTTYG